MVFVARFTRFQQCKNFENQLGFDKVTKSWKVGTFFETQRSTSTDKMLKHNRISSWAKKQNLMLHSTHNILRTHLNYGQ